MINVQMEFNKKSMNDDPSVIQVYHQFLKNIKTNNSFLYQKVSSIYEDGNLEMEEAAQSELEGEVLKIALNISLINFVVWKDNIVHKDEVRLSKLIYTIFKSCFPKQNNYQEYAMNKHLGHFLGFLLCDFEFEHLPVLLKHLYSSKLPIDKREMKVHLETISKIDGHQDLREEDVIKDIIWCFYENLISVDEFIVRLKKGIDFKKLKESAHQIAELKPFLN